MKILPLIVCLFVLTQVTVIAQTNIAETLSYQNFQREYIVHLPPTYTGIETVSAVLVLHGGSGTNQNVQGFTEMNLVSNQNGFLAVYPEGFGIASPGFSWADGRGTSADREGIDDVGFIDKLIDSLISNYNVNPQEVYVCGFSNGGFMTQRLACELGDRFAAVGGLGCSMDTSLFSNCKPGRAVPMMYVSGTADEFVPFEGGEMNGGVKPIVAVDSAVQFWARNNKCQSALEGVELPNIVMDDNSTAERFDFTDCECEADVRFFKLIGAGHTWAGVELVAQEPLLGETNEDIHASFELWDFFEKHSFCNVSTHIETHQNDGIKIQLYPNPASEYVMVDCNKLLRFIELRDLVGRRIQTIYPTTNRIKIDIRQLREGIYSQISITDSGQRIVHKFIKH